MNKILQILVQPLSRFTHAQQAPEPLGELLWVKNAHTVVPWKPKFAKPPALRQPLLNNDPLNPVPRAMDPIEVGCVTRTMRKIAAEARQELGDLQELQPMHARASAPQAPVVVATPRNSGRQWRGTALFACAVLYIVIINTL
jgi:hypothetical protein